MADQYRQTLFTPAVLAAQQRQYGRSAIVEGAPEIDPLTDEERAFIETRDSFYMATISENGWPYVQHRGGPAGFLRVLNPTQLALLDYSGNRQMLTAGNLSVNNRVSLFLMDYPRRERLKILGWARMEDVRQHPLLASQLAGDGGTAANGSAVERIVFIDILSFDWNCPKYITPRFTAAEIEKIVEPLRRRIAELEPSP